MKAAPVIAALANSDGVSQLLVHTGQHYDENMSRIFFDELNIPKPDYNLSVGSGKHGLQTSKMIRLIEEILLDEMPDAVLLYGDTNSTLSGAIAAGKLNIPIYHVEAGLRSYNKLMPEEQNRILTDHLSSLLFCPTKTAVDNLYKENIKNNVYNVGDIMFDAVLNNNQLSLAKYDRFETAKYLKPCIGETKLELDNDYYLATIHRAENTDSKQRLKTIVQGMINSEEKEKADIQDPEVKKLADDIIKAQEKEIAEMKAMIKRLENNK